MVLILRLTIGFVLCYSGIVAQSQVGTDSEALLLYRRSKDKSLPFQAAIISGQNAVKEAVRSGDGNLAKLANTQLGILYWLDGQFANAIQHLNNGQQLSITLSDSINWAQCTHYKGLVYYYKSEFDSALLLYGLAEKTYKQYGNDSAQAKVKSHKGLIYSATGKYRLAAQNMIESYHLRESQPQYRDLSLPIEFLFDASEQLYYKSKLDQDLESLRYIENKNDRNTLAFTLHNIGLDYCNLTQYELALQYFKRSIHEYKSLSQPSLEGDLARAYEGLGLYDSAVLYYKNWINETKEIDTQLHLGAAYMNLGLCYRRQKKWDDALHFYLLSADLNLKIGTKRSESVNHNALAVIYCEKREWRKALDEVQMSLTISRAIGCIKDIQEGLKIKARILQALQRSKEAFDVLSQSLAIQDSIMVGENQLQIVQLQIEYETEKKNRELSDLQIQNKLNETKIESTQLQIALVLSVLSIIAVAGGWYFYRYRQKKKLSNLLADHNKIIELQNADLEKKNKEKEVLLSEIHHRVKNNLQIITSLVNLRSLKADEGFTEFLIDLSNKIQVMGLVHDMLYKMDNLEKVNMHMYLQELTMKISSSLAGKNHNVEYVYPDKSIELELDKALSLGLIHNELLTNSIKYANPSGILNIVSGLRMDSSNKKYIYFIKDNGIDSVSIVPSFGLRFVEQIVKQKLNGELIIVTGGGVSVEIHFFFD